MCSKFKSKNKKILTFFLCMLLLIIFYEKIEKQKSIHIKLDTKKVIYDKNIKEKFDSIYEKNFWGEVGGGSGPGSSTEYTTKTREIIYTVIKEYEINSMIDAPCGGMIWMPLLLDNITQTNSNFKYHGIDIAEKVINHSQIRFAKKPNWQFSLLDFTEQDLPNGYELIHSRDAYQHLPLVKIINSLERISKLKDARYLLVGSYLDVKNGNRNINIGEYFLINLTIAPFNLKEYLSVFKEKLDSGQKYLVLYDIQNYLKTKVDFNKMRLEAQRIS